MERDRLIGLISWLLALVVTVLAIVAWGQGFGWQLSSLNSYLLFPIFGLLAFSLMWTHYISGALRRLAKVNKSAIQPQLAATGYLVLVLILLHPTLLIWQLWRDGRGLPPSSYLQYVGPALHGAVLLGSLSLVVFLAYELKRWFGGRDWWHWVARLGDVAMVAIFYHALRLGSQTQSGWFHWVWFFYGLTLVASLGLIYYKDRLKEPGV